MPTPEEVMTISKFSGDIDQLGQAEKYMKVMMKTKYAVKCIQTMIYKQQFRTRITEIRTSVKKIEGACDDLKLSVRLKKVLKTILKVGNQLNDGADSVGFTVDSLLKLQNAKALDKKTSILQYIVTLLYRNDKDCLLFPEDLKFLSDSSRITMESIVSERNALRTGLENCEKTITNLKSSETDEELSKLVEEGVNTMKKFLLLVI